MQKNEKKSKYIFQKISRFLLKVIFEIFLIIIDIAVMGIGFLVLLSLFFILIENRETTAYGIDVLNIVSFSLIFRFILLKMGLPSVSIRWFVFSFPELCRIIWEDKAQRLTELTEDTKKENN